MLIVAVEHSDDEGYASWGEDDCRPNWFESCRQRGRGQDEIASDGMERAGLSLSFEWCAMVTGCAPILPRDPADAFARLGVQQRQIPMYESTETRHSTSPGKRVADCLSDDDEMDMDMDMNFKRRRLGARETTPPATSQLLGYLLTDVWAEGQSMMAID